MTIARVSCVALAAAFALVGAGHDGRRSLAVGDATFAAGIDPAGLVVTSLRSGGRAGGLRVGDVIERIDDVGHPGIAQLEAAARRGHAWLRVHRRGDAGEPTLLRMTHGGGA